MPDEVRVVEIPGWVRCTQCKGFMKNMLCLEQEEIDRRGMICEECATENWLVEQEQILEQSEFTVTADVY